MASPSPHNSARALAMSESDRMTYDQAVTTILDAAIDAAPELVRRRMILSSVDWTMVAPAKVERMFSRLELGGVACPRWLSRAVLVAGHTVDDGRELPAHLRVLDQINRLGRVGDVSGEAGPLVDGLVDDWSVDVEIVEAIVRKLVACGAFDQAVRLALAHGHRTQDALRAVTKYIDEVTGQLPPVRLRLTGFSTTQILADALRPSFAAKGWQASVTQSEFGGGLSELGKLEGQRDALVLLLDLEGFAPIDWRNPPGQVAELLSERVKHLVQSIGAFAERSAVPLLINTVPSACAPSMGLLDGCHASGMRRAVDLINSRLFEVAEGSARLLVIDSDRALADIPRSRQVDQKLWFYGRIAHSVEATWALARAFADAWNLLRRGPIKVLAVDLDNTLWGGVYGDDGVERLACGHEFPGNAFLAMQQECLRLRSQGVLLAALSKNNADAITAFEWHPEMALKAADFATTAVNWEPKAENMRRVAAELNVGLDSFMFIDDSPHERDAMRRLCPEVRVPEMPNDPAERPMWLRRQVSTWPARLTAEDERRGAFYSAGQEAERWRTSATSHEDFLQGLRQRLGVGRVNRATVARIAQMHQRTNQFNLTTVRSTEADIASLAGDGSRGLALYGRASDRFGDHGIVIAAVAEINDTEAVLQSFVMSCRVIGREIERAFLGEALRELGRLGVDRVYGKYMPTPKNAMVRDFYPSCGFAQAGGEEEAWTTWVLDLSNRELPASQFVTVSWES